MSFAATAPRRAVLTLWRYATIAATLSILRE